MRFLFLCAILCFSVSAFGLCEVSYQRHSFYSPTTWRYLNMELHDKGFRFSSSAQNSAYQLFLNFVIPSDGGQTNRFVELIVKKDNEVIHIESIQAPEYVENRNRKARFLISRLPHCF